MTTSTTPPVLLIAASPSLRSRSGALLAGAAERLHHHGLSTRTLRLRELPAQSLLHADVDDPAIRDALAAVAEARVVVLATPIYKAAYSGLLKVFLDLLPQDGLAGKPVWTLATGGSLAHLLALDYGLLPVLSALGARAHIDGVYASDAQIPKDAAGEYRVADDIGRRLLAGAAQVLERVPAPVRAASATRPALVL
ncbi:NADPH-dependent FMN reductase [Mitsuaria sp. GD03876]|uniref:NADPH-dependent FMN reductase n=1 Tax=Mitsuaria sp. GD03876 TaxID=2975399 RepID=UPI00244D75D6|nr:NADPH-dependent FMN reductase [Mitsuaria sp. GD03876]MDH0866151.1 NADPH-dependent FMN reductase [Mitsuaria sp. GD03876]